ASTPARLYVFAHGLLRVQGATAPADPIPTVPIPHTLGSVHLGEGAELSIVALPLVDAFAPLWSLTLPAVGAVVRLDFVPSPPRAASVTPSRPSDASSTPARRSSPPRASRGLASVTWRGWLASSRRSSTTTSSTRTASTARCSSERSPRRPKDRGTSSAASRE